MRTVPIVGLDLSSLALREGAALPLIEGVVPVQEWLADCLKQTIAERRGVILLSPHGAGKSLAVARDVARFDAAEEARRQTKDVSYVPRRVVVVTTLRVESARELFVALYRAAFDTLPADRVFRRTKTSDELRDELVARAAEENVVAFVIDEAQTLSSDALEALRDLMAVSESANPERLERTARGERVRPAGLGVLLVGTLALQPRLPGLSEYGRRWVRTETVGLIEPAAVVEALPKLLAAFAAGAKTMGTEAWAAFVTQTLTQGRALPISALQDITRTYLRRAAELQPKARTLADLRWDEELFRQATYELIGLSFHGQAAA